MAVCVPPIFSKGRRSWNLKLWVGFEVMFVVVDVDVEESGVFRRDAKSGSVRAKICGGEYEAGTVKTTSPTRILRRL